MESQRGIIYVGGSEPFIATSNSVKIILFIYFPKYKFLGIFLQMVLNLKLMRDFGPYSFYFALTSSVYIFVR